MAIKLAGIEISDLINANSMREHIAADCHSRPGAILSVLRAGEIRLTPPDYKAAGSDASGSKFVSMSSMLID